MIEQPENMNAGATKPEGSQGESAQSLSSSSLLSRLEALEKEWRAKAEHANRVAIAAIRWNVVATAASSGRESDVLTECADALEAVLSSALTEGAGTEGHGLDAAAMVQQFRETLAELGVVKGATIASVQRRLHVGTADAMRLLSLNELAGAMGAVRSPSVETDTETGSEQVADSPTGKE